MAGSNDTAEIHLDEYTIVTLTPDEEKQLASDAAFNDFQRNKLEKDAKKNWDLFYKRNGDRFFKKRYWTRREFQELFAGHKSNLIANGACLYLLEIGCGCGDFVLPLIEDDTSEKVEHTCDKLVADNLFIYCCDISDKAIEILMNNPIYKANSPSRIVAFTADLTQDPGMDLMNGLSGQSVDIVSLIFVLSALEPNKMSTALANVNRALKLGGLVLFRDYAIYDRAMIRFKKSSKICDQFYARQDGTRAYFFSKEQLLQLFESNGFRSLSIDYIRRETLNNSTKDKFSRIFLQAKFEKVT